MHKELRAITTPKIPAAFLDNGRLMSRPINTSCGHVVQQILNQNTCSFCNETYVNATPNVDLAIRIRDYVSQNFAALSNKTGICSASSLTVYWGELNNFITQNSRERNIQDDRAGLIGGERVRRYDGEDDPNRCLRRTMCVIFCIVLGGFVYFMADYDHGNE